MYNVYVLCTSIPQWINRLGIHSKPSFQLSRSEIPEATNVQWMERMRTVSSVLLPHISSPPRQNVSFMRRYERRKSNELCP